MALVRFWAQHKNRVWEMLLKTTRLVWIIWKLIVALRCNLWAELEKEVEIFTGLWVRTAR